MAFYDLREFINALESRGMLKRIKTPVDCNLEITEITDRVSKMEGKKNVALLFENVKGYDMPVLMNAFGSMERLALAFGVNDIEEIPNELREILRLPYISLQNKMDLIHIIPTAKRAINFPKYVKKAPCQEVVITDNPTLDKFPILKCWPQDGVHSSLYHLYSLAIQKQVNVMLVCIVYKNMMVKQLVCTGIFIKMVLATIALIKKWVKIKLKLLSLLVQIQ